MLERIKNTIKDTFIYSLSNIAPKIIGVILLPIYTAYLNKAEFGTWDLLDVTTNILAEIFLFGQAASLIFLNNSSEFKEKKKITLFTLFIFLFVAGTFLIIISELFISLDIITDKIINTIYIRLIALIVLFRTLNNLFLSKYRAEEKAIFFSSISIIKLLIIAALTIYFIVNIKKGIEGIFLAAVIGEAIISIFLFLSLIRQMNFKFDFKILKISLKFGFPLIFASLGIMLLNLSDRYIITYFLGYEANAIYGLGYRVAGVLNMFLVMPFSMSLMPIAFKYYGQQDDKRFFSKIMTYSTFVFIWGSIFISLFSKEIIKIFALKPEFYNAFYVVPIILFSYVFSGMRLTASLGMMLTKNTKHIASITLGAAILNIVLNLIFVPYFGILAAAINTLIAFVIFYYITQKVSNRYFPIPFENKKLILMICTGIILSSFGYFLKDNFIYQILKIIIACFFPATLYLLGFFELNEINFLNYFAKKLIVFKNGKK
ncbi:oligosaccharide flippase family protein [Rosettibacter firmus]|uniref:oligosaccharide flippase family protein n=1 Tax=Rosettibacter firmus TaxID=3111522 RepID=UPI00336BDB0D